MIQSMCIMLTILHIFLTLIGLSSLKAHFSWQGAKRTYLILSNINMNLYNWTIFLKYVESEKTLTSSVISDVISFFVTKKMSKLQRMNSSYLLNDLRNFNEIFTKCVTYDNSHKKTGFHPLQKIHFSNPAPSRDPRIEISNTKMHFLGITLVLLQNILREKISLLLRKLVWVCFMDACLFQDQHN